MVHRHYQRRALVIALNKTDLMNAETRQKVMGRHGAAVATIFALVAAVACGDDGGGDDGGVDAADAVATGPMIPWLEDGEPPIERPTLTPCPPGWREVVDRDLVTCDPFSEGGPESCAADEVHLPGTPGCAPLGDPCPASDFAEGLPTDGSVLYVQASAAAGGDGSLATPFAALSEVRWSSLAAGTTVALAKGTYPGTIGLRVDVRVVGACAAETILTGLATPAPAVISVSNAGEPAVVRNVTLRGAPQYGALVAGSGRRLRMEGVVIDRCEGRGVFVDDGGELAFEGALVRDTQTGADGLGGLGAEVRRAGRLVVSRSVFDANQEHGVYVQGAGSVAIVSDSMVRGTLLDAAGRFGRGIAAESARLEASRVVLEGNHGVALIAGLEGSEAVLEDLLVRGSGDNGLALQDGIRVTASRLVVTDNRDDGLLIADAPDVTLTDVVIAGTRSDPDGNKGRGLGVHRSTVAVTRAVVEGNRDVGVLVGGSGSVTLTDLVVRDTLPQDAGELYGRGLEANTGARVELVRALVERSAELGINVASGGTSLTLSDVAIRDHSAAADDGRALQVQAGARVAGARVSIAGAGGLGVMVTNGSEMDVEDVDVSDVRPRGCVTSTCASEPWGYGIATIDSMTSVRRFSVSSASLCGVLVANIDGGAALDLSTGAVSGAEIGACVQVDGYDLSRLTNDVEYRDNRVNLDSTSLPVPAALGSIGE